MEKARECYQCHKSDNETKLRKCVICHKKFCENCGHKMSGRIFCSRYCAEYFFHSREEED